MSLKIISGGGGGGVSLPLTSNTTITDTDVTATFGGDLVLSSANPEVRFGTTGLIKYVSDGILAIGDVGAGTTPYSIRLWGDGETAATKYLSLGHDGTNGVIDATGSLILKDDTVTVATLSSAATVFTSAQFTFNGPTFLNDGSANQQLSGWKARVLAISTTPSTWAIYDSNSLVTNEGATASIQRTLPSAASGLTESVVIQDADGMRLTAATGDTIRVIDKVTAAAGYIESTTIGSVVTLVAINTTEWVATSIHGVWTDGTFTYDDTSLTTP